MVGTVDLRRVHGPTLDEVPLLNAYVQQIVGQPFMFFRESYGGELTLHLGATLTVQPPNTKLMPTTRGSYVLTLRGSSWSLTSGPEASVTVPFHLPGGAAGKPMQLKELVQSPPVTPGAPVVWTSVGLTAAGFGVLVRFGDGSQLAVAPDDAPETPNDTELPPVADWELFTPYGMYLKVGPGTQWGYLPSRTP
jgi:hypothetical protein